jgi:hypothetical protein
MHLQEDFLEEVFGKGPIPGPVGQKLQQYWAKQTVKRLERFIIPSLVFNHQVDLPLPIAVPAHSSLRS